MVRAFYWNRHNDSDILCELCPHNCLIPLGGKGICEARENKGGELIAANYGLISSMAIDPIEKKPLYHFHSGRPILSVGSYNCNMDCGFCQNHSIASPVQKQGRYISPEALAEYAADIPNNIGVAYTYNEPLINYEFVLDTAKHVKAHGLNNVLVTNGLINEKPLEALLPYIDALNIDLKGFTEEYYKMLGGSLQAILDTISLAHKHCHIEITFLVIPPENEHHISDIAQFTASLSDSIPLHISRFFPMHRYIDKPATPPETVLKLCETASKYLKYVYSGNM